MLPPIYYIFEKKKRKEKDYFKVAIIIKKTNIVFLHIKEKFLA